MVKTEIVEVLVEGGKASAAPPLGSSLGPLKVNITEVVKQINDKTIDFKGMKVPVKVIVNTETKDFKIEIGTPPTSQLIKKELNIQKGSGKPHIEKSGVIMMEQIIKIAKMKRGSLFINDLKSAVKTIVGSCVSLGLLIEGKEPKEVIKEIDDGVYDNLIDKMITDVPGEKEKKFADLKKKIAVEVKLREKKKEEEKAAAVAKKEEATEAKK